MGRFFFFFQGHTAYGQAKVLMSVGVCDTDVMMPHLVNADVVEREILWVSFSRQISFFKSRDIKEV